MFITILGESTTTFPREIAPKKESITKTRVPKLFIKRGRSMLNKELGGKMPVSSPLI